MGTMSRVSNQGLWCLIEKLSQWWVQIFVYSEMNKIFEYLAQSEYKGRKSCPFEFPEAEPYRVAWVLFLKHECSAVGDEGRDINDIMGLLPASI